MYLWHCVFAVVFGLTWYFSVFRVFGCFLVPVGCALCFILFTVDKSDSVKCESSTQTECVPDEDAPQLESETGHFLDSDEPDTAVGNVQKTSLKSQYPNIQRSLQHMFNCAYTQLVLPWSTSPELGDSHPLRAALLTDFNFVMYEIICKVKDKDLTVLSLGCIQILTQHLHNTKQTERSPAFSSKAEEITAIKGFCKALIHNLLPKHLWEAEVYYYALQEILVTRALAFVEMLSNPDSLNQLIISLLDDVSSENQMKRAHVPDKEIPFSKCIENSDVLQNETEKHPSKESKAKKKGNKLKQGFSKMLEGLKPKKQKRKRMEDDVIPTPSRRPASSIKCDCETHEDDISFDFLDVESSLQEETMEFKLSYEMWRFGDWLVTVTSVQTEENELRFTIHLEERNNPENLHWDVKKNQTDIIHFYNQFKEVEEMSSLLKIVEEPKQEWNKEEARGILAECLQKLLANSELGKSELVFNFLGPINWIFHEEKHEEGMWVILERIASFLTPGQDDDDDDEVNNFKVDEKQHEPTPQSDPDTAESTCTEEQDNDTDDECLVADGETTHAPEHNFTHQSEKHHTDNIPSVCDQPEENPVGENMTQYGARINDPEIKPNLKKEASSHSSSESDEETSDCITMDTFFGWKNNISKEENRPHRKSKETDKSHTKEETWSQPGGETKMSNYSKQPKASKVIFDLLKEVTGNSYIIKVIKNIVSPFTSLANKQVDAFIKKMNPSEAQIAIYIDELCNNTFPDAHVPQPPVQSNDKNETKQKALQLVTTKYAGMLVNKVNVESTFKIFQNEEENKKLVYMLLIYLLNEFLPGEPGFNVMSKLNVKPSNFDL